MARTVKNLLLEIDELRQRLCVFGEIQAFLSKHVKDEVTDFKMPNGNVVSAATVNNLLAEFDDTLGEIEERIKELEEAEVKDGREPGAETGRARKKS